MLAKAINWDWGENRVAHCLGPVASLIGVCARAFAFGQSADLALIALRQKSLRNQSVDRFFFLFGLAVTALTTISSHLLGWPYAFSTRSRV